MTKRKRERRTQFRTKADAHLVARCAREHWGPSQRVRNEVVEDLSSMFDDSENSRSIRRGQAATTAFLAMELDNRAT